MKSKTLRSGEACILVIPKSSVINNDVFTINHFYVDYLNVKLRFRIEIADSKSRMLCGL